MKELNIEPYPINVIRRNEATGQLEPAPMNYDIKDSLIGLLFNRDLQLSARDLLERDPLGRKISDAEGPTLLLENKEYEIIKKAVDTFKGYTRNDIELVKRVYEAKTVEVEKKIQKGEPVNVEQPESLPQ